MGREIELHSRGKVADSLLAGLRAMAERSMPLGAEFDFQGHYEASDTGRPTNPGPPYAVVCIDEGTEADRYADTREKGIIHSPGSGILFIPKVTDSLKGLGIGKVYSHFGCGAAALHANENGIDLPTDDVAVRGAQELSDNLGAEYGGHLILTGRPAPIHPAKVVYYIADKHVEPSRVALLPPGFEISRWAMPRNIAERDTNLAMQIAHGPSGLGAKYFSSPDRPLHLVGIATKRDAQKVDGEINDIIRERRFPHIRASLIVTKN